jgi:hypothetical protein
MTESRWYWEDPGGVLEEMSAEEFYETFRHAESLDCLRILGDGYREIARPASLSPVFTVEEDALLVEMLQANGGCDLPCWWGITPGATSVQDAQQVFLAYGKPVGIPWWSSDQPRYLVGAFGQHIPVLFDYVVEHEFSAEGDIVSCLRVVGEPPVWASYSQRLNSDWQRYSLSAVLTRLGSPSQVSVFHDHPTCGDAYQLRVLYDDLGIKISYDGVVNREAGTVTICPAAGGFVGIRMTLFSPALIADEELEREHGAYGDLDSDIDPEIFYQTFVDSNTQTCLEFPEQTEYTCP